MKLNARFFSFALALCALLAPASVQQQTVRPLDDLAPKTDGKNALTRQLHTVTLITADLDPVLRFYRDALGLTVRGPSAVDDKTRRIQRELWGIPGDVNWQLYLLGRPNVPATVQIRLLVVDRRTSQIKTDWVRKQPGPYAMGFPALELENWDQEIRAKGYQSTPPEMMNYPITRKDGSSYTMHETIFNAPDFVQAVTLSRRSGMPQMGPVDPQTGRGGPLYSTQIVRDSEKVLDFYTSVLGMELRSDREWGSGENAYRFSIVFAEGASYGHLLFLDYRDNALAGSGVAPRPPNRGLVMWSFPVRDLAEVEGRAKKAGIAIVGQAVNYESLELGRHRALTVLAPNGFLVELFESVK
ncbi:MAG: VOC family protein [Blastocatellia bacterium]